MAFGRVLKSGKVIPLTGEEKKRLKKKGIDVSSTCSDQKSVDRMIKEVKKEYQKDEGGSSSSSSSSSSSEASDSDSNTNSFSSVSGTSESSDEQDVPSDSSSDSD